HARQPAHLALDPPQALEHRSLGNGSHTAYIPPRGILFKAVTVVHQQASHRSGLRDESRSREVATPLPARREDLSFLLSTLPDQLRGRAREISFPARPLAAITVRDDLHLPDASANPATGARQLPDLRHGARARHRRRRDRPQPRIDRYDADF